MAILLGYKDWVIVELTNIETEKAYVVRLPDYSEPGFYRQTVSFSAFFHSIKKFGKEQRRRNTDPVTGKIYYACEPRDMERPHTIFPPKIRRVENIYAFYKEVGYDYKKRRWLKASERVPAAP